jgi:MFS family permease
MVVVGLGTVWILDGLEVTIVGNVATRLSEPGSGLHISAGQVTGLAAALYVAGACAGALFFGWLTDRYGRRKLFMLTLCVYLAATALTALSWNAAWFFAFRFLTGFGIGGEYAAINSAIDELIPSKHRGRVDLVINGSYWLGAAVGALLAIPALNEHLFPADVGWRLTFALGVLLGLVVLLVRRHVPESPRWMFIHGQDQEANDLVDDIEERVRAETGADLPEPAGEITIRQRRTVGFLTIAKTVVKEYPKRGILGVSLFIGQAFLYNAITFGYASILTTFFKVPSGSTGYYYVAIAVGNFMGPVLLAPLFDTVGRKPMITGSYVVSGLLLLVTAWLFNHGSLSATSMTAAWTVVLFFASAGASSAYLTVSEIFPMETRALAIAFFYAVGTAAGGISGPLIFSALVGTGKVADTAIAFVLGASLMIAAGLVEAAFGVKAERRSLEDIARPLTADDDGGAAALRAA